MDIGHGFHSVVIATFTPNTVVLGVVPHVRIVVLITHLVTVATTYKSTSDGVVILGSLIAHKATIGLETRPVPIVVIEVGRSTCWQDVTRLLALLWTSVCASSIFVGVASHHVSVT